ncbi:MAG: hypothetical protein ANABAC_3358 [Anaerolineae bacterium]|jgi:hypothetical protein|nr:MAG: hypothetical protein ANABAC_3358 [Anaerolineae bacterium]
MNTRKRLLLLVLAAIFVLSSISPLVSPVRLTVRNNTYTTVYLKLEGKNAYYYLSVYPGDVESYTIKPTLYKATFWGCGTKKVFRKLNIRQQIRIIFPPCNATAKSTEKKILRVLFSK